MWESFSVQGTSGLNIFTSEAGESQKKKNEDGRLANWLHDQNLVHRAGK